MSNLNLSLTLVDVKLVKNNVTNVTFVITSTSFWAKFYYLIYLGNMLTSPRPSSSHSPPSQIKSERGIWPLACHYNRIGHYPIFTIYEDLFQGFLTSSTILPLAANSDPLTLTSSQHPRLVIWKNQILSIVYFLQFRL